MTMIFGGIHTPFVLDVTFRGADAIDTTVKLEFDTLPEARAALEDLVLSNEDSLDDFSIDFRRGDLMGGDLVKFDLVTVTDPDRPERPPHTRKVNIAKGVWSISWRKPEPPEEPLLADAVIRKELRALLAEMEEK